MKIHTLVCLLGVLWWMKGYQARRCRPYHLRDDLYVNYMPVEPSFAEDHQPVHLSVKPFLFWTYLLSPLLFAALYIIQCAQETCTFTSSVTSIVSLTDTATSTSVSVTTTLSTLTSTTATVSVISQTSTSTSVTSPVVTALTTTTVPTLTTVTTTTPTSTSTTSTTTTTCTGPPGQCNMQGKNLEIAFWREIGDMFQDQRTDENEIEPSAKLPVVATTAPAELNYFQMVQQSNELLASQ